MNRIGPLSLALSVFIAGCTKGPAPVVTTAPAAISASQPAGQAPQPSSPARPAKPASDGGQLPAQGESRPPTAKPTPTPSARNRAATPLPAPLPAPRTDQMSDQMSAESAKKLGAIYQRATQEYVAGDFKACTQSFLAATRVVPGASDNAIWLYNAALCARHAGLVGTAIALSTRLLKQYPRSPLRADAQFGLADMSNAIGELAQAAQHYEEFNRLFPAHRQGWTALINATRLRIALGEHKQVRRNIERMSKLYARKRPKQVAEVAFAAIPGFRARDDERGLIAYLRAYLKHFGRADTALRVLATHELAMALWRVSCPTGTGGPDTPVGACLRRQQRAAVRPRKRPTRCGTLAAQVFWRPMKRNKKLASEAQKLFRRVITMAARQGANAGTRHDALVNDALAAAHYHTALPAFETGLRAPFPRGLKFSGQGQKSAARMRAWLQERERVHRDLQTNFGEVARLRSVRWSVAAAGRMGALMRHFADELNNAPVPADVRRGEHGAAKVEAFCSALGAYGKPLAELAVNAYEHCLRAANNTNYHDPKVGACVRALTEMRPAKYPPMRELFDAPTRTSTLGLAAGKDAAYWRAQLASRPGDSGSRLALAAALLDEYRALVATNSASAVNAERALRRDTRTALVAALSASPDDPRALVLYATLYLYSGDPADTARARLFLDRCLMADNDFAPAWNALGVVAIRERNWARAAMLFERARGLLNSKSRPESTRDILVNSGLLGLSGKQFADAHQHLSGALKTHPGDYAASVGLAVALRGLGKLDEARAAYERARASTPDRIEAYIGLAVLNIDFVAKNKSFSQERRARSLSQAKALLDQAKQRSSATLEDQILRDSLHGEVERMLAAP